MKIRIVALAFLTAMFCLALDVPPRPTQWVTDSAGLLSHDQVAKLNARLEQLEKRTHAQFIVYTMPSLGGEPLEDFTVRAAQAWGIGHKKEDNGLVLFVFRDDRKVRVEVGYGLEGTITDAISSRVIREEICGFARAGTPKASTPVSKRWRDESREEPKHRLETRAGRLNRESIGSSRLHSSG